MAQVPVLISQTEPNLDFFITLTGRDSYSGGEEGGRKLT
jgi:hypothetical protein